MKAGRLSWEERNPVPVALVGLVLLALVLALSASWQKLPFVDDSTTYRAEFTDASGLVPGEEVRVAGVKVGTVRAVDLVGQLVVVTFDVSGIELGDRTEAGIEVKTLLGQHYLSVRPAGDGELEKGVVPVDRTSTPLNIVPAFNRLAEQTAATDTEQVADAFDALAETLEATTPEVGDALDGLSRLSRTVTRRDEEIRSLFGRAEHVTGVVAARDRELSQLLSSSDRVLEVLDQRRDTIRALITGTRDLATQLQGLVSDNERALRPALEDLGVVLRVLRRNEAGIERSLTYLATYAREFNNVGGSGEWFDASLKMPRGFAVCSTNDSTDPLMGLLDPVLSAVNAAVNESDSPCLPLGPAVSSRLDEDLPAAGGGSR